MKYYISSLFLNFEIVSQQFETIVARLNESKLRENDEIIFKINESLKLELDDNEKIRKIIIERVKNREIKLIYLNNEKSDYILYSLNSKLFEEKNRINLVESIRSQDLNQLIQLSHNNFLFTSSGRYHYVLPSRIHSKEFINVGHAIKSIDSMDSIAFWLTPILMKSKIILVDNSNLFHIILYTMNMLGLKIPFDALEPLTHPDFELNIKNKLQKLNSTSRNSEKTITSILISISGSGKLQENIYKLIDQEGLKDYSEILSIYKYHNTPEEIKSLSILDKKFQNIRYDENDCDYCKKGEKALKIDPNLFIINDSIESKVILKPKYFENTFYNEYDSKNILSVHRNNQNDNRHHAFYIDIAKLLEEKNSIYESFIDYLKTVLDENPPSVIILPEHNTAVKLQKIAKTVLKESLYILSNTLNLEKLSSTEKVEIDRAKSVLFLDDSIITGNRFSNYNKNLRNILTSSENLQIVRFYAIVCRTESEKVYSQLKNSLIKNHNWNASINSAVKIFLPNWTDKECPWCKELDILNKISVKYYYPPPLLSNRIYKLNDKDNGLIAEPLFLFDGNCRVNLGTSSLVGNAGMSEIAALFSISHAIQNLRNSDESPLLPSIPFSQVFGEANLTLYTEELLQAIILRVLKPIEWGEKNSGDVFDLIKSKIQMGNFQYPKGELLLAIMKGTFYCNDSDFDFLFESLDAELIENIESILLKK